jgi:multidrug efflux pump subunit AcrA (membrane-fusion protein)
MAAPGNDIASATTALTTWREIERLVDEVSTLARGTSSPLEFYEGLLHKMIHAAGSAGGIVWMRTPAGSFRSLCQHLPAGELLAEASGKSRTFMLAQASQHGKSLRVEPQPEGAERPIGGDLAESPRWFCPIAVDGEVVVVVELFERGFPTARAQGKVDQLLDALCELASDFQRRLQMSELKRWRVDAERIEEFAQAVHRHLDLQQVTYAIANEGRRLLGWDRVSVLVRRGRSFRVEAMSGADTVDRRASLVRSLEHLADVVLATGESLWYGEAAVELAPDQEQALQVFLDESHARSVVALPLQAAPDGQQTPSHVVGALVLERFSAEENVVQGAGCTEAVARHSAAAVRNALEHRALPGFLLLNRLARLRWLTRLRQLPLVVLAGLVVALLAGVLAFVPMDFYVEARGELQPEIRRDVFAPGDGVVQAISVDHGQTVAAGELLVEMRQSELDLEFARILGELQTARRQLDSVQATRLQPRRSTDGADLDSERLTSQEEELKKLVEGLESQRQILLAQRSELRILSPITGQILSWEVRQTLEARPVQRGQRLLTIADPQGPWILELRVPDRDIGYVLTAQAAQGLALPVSFLLATDPATQYRGQVEQVARAPETNEDQQATVLVTVRVPSDQLRQPRPGASVLAKVYCGRRAAGFVWFHDLLEAWQTYILF